MSEVTFAKAFLTQLDRKPIKLPADYVSDPRSYPSQSPYTLPKQSHPYSQPALQTASDLSPLKPATISITLKPTRAGTSNTVTLTDISVAETSVYDLKTKYAAQAGLAGQEDKIKLLLNKKPAADLKTLKDLGVSPDGGQVVELSVMIMGGVAFGSRSGSPAASSPSAAMPVTDNLRSVQSDKMDLDPLATTATATGAPESEKAQLDFEQKSASEDSGTTAILKTDEFWSDLQGFLSQRLRDDQGSQRLVEVFRKAVSA